MCKLYRLFEVCVIFIYIFYSLKWNIIYMFMNYNFFKYEEYNLVFIVFFFIIERESERDVVFCF